MTTLTDINSGAESDALSREEQIAFIEKLISEGKRNFYADDYNAASEKLGEALEISSQVYDSLASENFEPNLWYGRAMLELCRMEGDVLDSLPEATDNDDDMEEVEENDDKSADQESNTEEDNEAASDIQIAWETLEIARAICEKETQNKEWELKKADVLFHLSDVSLINDDFDKAIEDLDVAVVLQKKHLNANDRIIAQTYLQLARSYKAKDDYANAAAFYKLSKDTIMNKIAELEADDTEKNQIQAEIEDLRSIANDLSLKVEDAEESCKQMETELNLFREKMGLKSSKSVLQESTSAPAIDITNKINYVWMNVSQFELTSTMIASKTTLVELDDDYLSNPTQNPAKLIAVNYSKNNSTEIACASNRLVYIADGNGTVTKKYSVEYDINKIMWTTFYPCKDDKENAGLLKCLAIIGEQDIMFVYNDATLPYTYFIRDVYQTKYGIMIEQAWMDDGEFRLKQKEHVYLFSLTHPLNELLPVLYRPRDFIGQWLFCWEKEEVSLVDICDDMVLIYDRANKLHCLYHLRHTSSEEIKSSIELQRNIQCDKLDSTPRGPKFSTPKVAYEGTSRSIQTRSMLRLTRTKTFPIDSPALSNIGTPVLTDSLDSPLFKLRSIQGSLNSENLTRILARDMNNDLFYAEFSLECIWTEPSRKEFGDCASKAFLSQSFCLQQYLNYVVPDAQQLRCIRFDTSSNQKSVANSSFSVIPCFDATYLESERHTIVLESERYITLYSGPNKVCAITYPAPLDEGIRLILPGVNDTFVTISQANRLALMEIRPLYGDELVFNNHDDVTQELNHSLCPLVHAAFRWIIEQMGIVILNHPMLKITTLPKVESDQTGAPQPKVKCPPTSPGRMLTALIAWEERSFDLNPPFKDVSIQVVSEKPFFSNCQNLFASMHSVWQQWGLQSRLHILREQLMEYLKICSEVLCYPTIKDFYEEEFPEANIKLKYMIQNLTYISKKSNVYLDNAFMLYKTMEDLLYCSKTMARFTSQLYTSSPKTAQFLFAIAVGLKVVIHQVDLQRFLGTRWKKLLMPSRLGSEQDLLKIVQDKKMTPEEKCAKLLYLFGFNAAAIRKMPCVLALTVGQIILRNKAAAEILYPKSSEKQKDYPNSQTDAAIAQLRWPSDLRLMNVQEMLRSDKPVLISTSALLSQTSYTDERELQEIFLHGACIRYLSQAFGRAMKDFRGCETIQAEEDGNIVPDLNLTARLFPSNMSYDIPATRPYREWGEFYNGVATALRVGDADHVKLDNEHIISLCIKQDKLSVPTAAGLLYGFALNGHILNSTYHISEMLISMDEFQSVAILLGCGISKMGSGDYRVYKMLGTQLPCFMGPTSLSVSVPHINQAAAIASLGFLFAQTGNNTIVGKLINEIGKCLPPEEISTLDRYSYRLNAGFSVGLIHLGQGEELLARRPPFNEEQPSIVDRLIHMLLAHPRELSVFPPEPTYYSEHFNSTQLPASCHEKDEINSHLSGHPACIALGMMFLKSNNLEIAKRIALPNTITGLEAIRPDMLMARTLFYNLIMWDKIESTKEFIFNLVPSVVESFLHVETRCCKGEENEMGVPFEIENIVDMETLCQVWCYVVAGACMGIAMKYKNSSQEEKIHARDVVLFFLRFFLPSNDFEDMKEIIDRTGKYVASHITNILITSLGILMIGTGDLECIRIAKVWRINEPVITWMRSTRKHFEQLCAHQLLGLTFMGNGRYAFKEDLLSNALIIIAFYPKPSHGVNDSRFYHQPLRFLWTQAVEPRILAPFSAEKDPHPCDILIKYKDNTEERFTAPCVIPPLDKISNLVITAKELEPIKYDLNIEAQKLDLKSLLSDFHGKLKMNENDLKLTDKDFKLDSHGFSCTIPVNSNPDDFRSRVVWPVMETTPAMKDHVKELETIILTCTKRKYIKPELQQAVALANWAEEDELAFSIELIMDKIISDTAMMEE